MFTSTVHQNSKLVQAQPTLVSTAAAASSTAPAGGFEVAEVVLVVSNTVLLVGPVRPQAARVNADHEARHPLHLESAAKGMLTVTWEEADTPKLRLDYTDIGPRLESEDDIVP